MSAGAKEVAVSNKEPTPKRPSVRVTLHALGEEFTATLPSDASGAELTEAIFAALEVQTEGKLWGSDPAACKVSDISGISIGGTMIKSSLAEADVQEDAVLHAVVDTDQVPNPP